MSGTVIIISGIVALGALTIGALVLAVVRNKRIQDRLEKELELAQATIETGTKRHADEAHEARMSLLTALDNLPLGLLMSDQKDQIVYMNDMVGRLFPNRGNRSLESVLYDSLAVREKSKECRRDLEACEPYIIEREGAIVRVQVVPIVAEEAIGTTATIEDIREATRLQRTKDEFFAVASHELRTPLTAIRGNAAMIQQYFAKVLSAEPELADMIADTHSASVRLIELVNDFLNASGLEQGRVDFKIKPFDLPKLTKDVVAKIESQAKEKGISLTVETVGDLPQAKADADRVKQVLFNLIGNALKFTDTGGVSVKIEAKKKQLKVSITDSGSGISQANQSLLFQKFQQVGSDALSRYLLGRSWSPC